jgi:asparagine synthetase B (glutamine-hydrolysing)
MCGVSGIIGRLDESNRAALRRINDAMVHRGPDATGTRVSEPDARGCGALLAYRYQPCLLRRILDPALFERPKSGFVLPFDRWIRRGLKQAMGGSVRDPQTIAPAGLDPAAVERLWRAFLDGAPGISWSRVWSIHVFIRWCHRNHVFR